MPTQKKQTKESSGGKKKKILIVEDERPLAHALELKFAREGFESTIAENGSDGLETAKKEKFDIILLDLIMPGMDGFAFMEQYIPKHKNVPIIVLSNLGQQEDEERALKLGAKAYYVKSNTPIAQIVSNVKSAL